MDDSKPTRVEVALDEAGDSGELASVALMRAGRSRPAPGRVARP
jgi:hypothetical protein